MGRSKGSYLGAHTVIVIRRSEKHEGNWLCRDCGVDTVAIGEYYMVNNDVWLSAGMQIGSAKGMLCIGCLEARLGRKLTPSDFPLWRINEAPSRSERFKARRGEADAERA
jgi:hypothetical protein